jgi:guanylate kinase
MAVITLTGPTCAGKSTIERVLQETYGCGRAISHTTRAMRAGEANGVDYHFVDDATYSAMKAHGDFIETIEFGAKRYAMSSAALQFASRTNEHTVIVVEPVGCAQILDYCMDHDIPTVPVWLDCNPKEQANRWILRLAKDVLTETSQTMCKAIDGHDISLQPVSGSFITAAERLGLMLTEEASWRECARNLCVGKSDWRYRALFWHTELGTPAAIAETILSVAVPLHPGERYPIEFDGAPA